MRDRRDSARKLAAVLAVPLLISSGHLAAAQPNDGKPDPPALAVKDEMIFYLAKGDADLCGAGCNEWIAAEGDFDLDAPRRLRRLLTEIGGRRPPIFFHSRGGFRSPAVTIGRLLRELGMTAGVSRTIAAGCVGVNADDCRTLQKSGQALEAELQHFALCASACVFAVIGAKFRIIPPGARIGVHSGKSERPDFAGVHKAVSNAQLGRYFREMGIADSLVDIILAVPHERLRHLTRDEIAELGIDTSEFQQTHWAFMELPARTAGPSALKLMLDTNADKRKEHRTSAIQLSCAAAGQTGSTDVLSFNYFRGLGRDEIWTIRSIALVVDEHKLALPKGSLGRLEAVEPGRPFDIRSAAVDVYFLQDAAGTGRMEIVESDVMEPAKPPLITKLSTAGLPKALERLKKACG